MEKTNKITEYFAEVETSQEHKGYFCSVGEALTIVILGTLCGLRNTSQIHQWAAHERVSGFLLKHFGIERIPCYYWFLCLLKMIKPQSLNQCFINWAQSFLPDGVKGLTLSFDGKAIRSTGKMSKYKSSLHIVSAHIAELGITFGQETVKAIVEAKADYLLSVKDNQETLKKDIEDYVQDDSLRAAMDTSKTLEKNRERIERREAFVTHDIESR